MHRSISALCYRAKVVKGLMTLIISIGFLQPAAQLNISPDTFQVTLLREVVVTASRIPESLLRSPASVQKAGKEFFNANGAFSFFDALENIPGVQMITPSIGFRILNTRGFANTTNVRFTQLVDGIDIQSPHIGSPIGNALGPGDLDINEVEIVAGSSATLYGMNAINGLANFSTKDAFTNQGLSVQQKTAVAQLGDLNKKPTLFFETSLRYAKSVSNKWAYKINFTHSAGTDWTANDYNDLNAEANNSTGLTGVDNPAKDPVNKYGNESSNRRTLSLAGKNYVVARTGFAENEVTSYSLRNIKGDVNLVFKPRDKTLIQYTFRGALLDNVYQRANRFRLKNYFIQQHALQLQSASIKANLYYNGENTGESYNLRSMAENLDRAFKPDNAWYSDYGNAYQQSVNNGAIIAEAHSQARKRADEGRFIPGTSSFQENLQRLQNINNWDSGAALRVNAAFVHADLQWNLGEILLKKMNKKTGIEVLTGIDYRMYIIQPDGNYFINPKQQKPFDNLLYSKSGVFISANKNVLQNKLRLGAAFRADKNDYFPVFVSPRFTAVYSPVTRHNFRVSWQAGYRYPLIFEAFSNVNSGGVKRVGGLPVMSNGIFENAWLQSSISTFQSAVLKDVNNNRLSQSFAIQRNKGLLQKNPYTYLRPEKLRSVELGYRGVLAEGKLWVDAAFYLNHYRSFIAQANMNVPLTSNADSIPFALYDRTKQNLYRMWTNSTSDISNHGFSTSVQYKMLKGYTANAGISYNQLSNKEKQDGLEDGFNTPAWMINLSMANKEIIKNLGAGITWRWQSAYLWQSFLASGNVTSYTTVDVQTTYRFSKTPLIVKLGGSNVLNRYYNSFLGGPSIGGFYYCTLTFVKNNVKI